MGWNISNPTIGTSSTAVVAANNARRGLVIINNSDTNIFLARGTAAVLNQGILINANGGTYENDPVVDGLPIDGFNAISSVAGKVLSVQERVM